MMMMSIEQSVAGIAGKPKYSEKICPNATFFTTNPKWPDQGSNPDHQSGEPATNHLSYGTALNSWITLCFDMYE
jgi:hypothetical protein